MLAPVMSKSFGSWQSYFVFRQDASDVYVRASSSAMAELSGNFGLVMNPSGVQQGDLGRSPS